MLKMNRRIYSKDKNLIEDFLRNFSILDKNDEKVFKYANQLTNIAHHEQVAIHIELEDVRSYFNHPDNDLASEIKRNARRYSILFSDVIYEILPSYKQGFVTKNKDLLDIYIEHRNYLNSVNFNNDNRTNINIEPRNKLPNELMKRFEVYFKDFPEAEGQLIRNVKTEYLGHLVTIRGVITRATDVAPLATVATYSCDQCGFETYQPINSLAFMPEVICGSKDCKTNKSGGRLNLELRGSKLLKFQKVKIQEHTDQVKAGRIPLIMTVYCRGEMTRQVSPGDNVIITGIYLPLRRSGFRQTVGGLQSETFLEAHNIIQSNNILDTDDNPLTPEELELLRQDNYTNIAASLSPEIFGHLDIKKALLLLLVGGQNCVSDDIKIRGNIHICLIGDPGVAKSQLLCYISRLSLKCRYTTGRGSSSVGLTAAIVRDPLTKETTLEGGVLIMADGGICCIDEFDKMMDRDRTAIHEAMEQQTISISKAGINVNLNARTSILAAANPAYGSYNPSKSIEQNIRMPSALLSRFDLVWLIQDKSSRDNDLRLAKHITYVHQNGQQPPTNHNLLSMGLIRKYLKVCKDHRPSITKELTKYAVSSYLDIRRAAFNAENSTFTSARNMLSVLRLSSALAKLRLADKVLKEDVDEAMRLIEMSKDSLRTTYSHRGLRVEKEPKVKIFELIQELDPDENNSVKISDIYERCHQKGFNLNEVDDCLDEYVRDEVWIIDEHRTKVFFI